MDDSPNILDKLDDIDEPMDKSFSGEDSGNLNALAEFAVTTKMVEEMESAELIWRGGIVRGHINVWAAPPNGGKTRLAMLAAEELSSGFNVHFLQEDAAAAELKAMVEQAGKYGFFIYNSALNSGTTSRMKESLNTLVSKQQDLSEHIFIFDTLKKFIDLMSKRDVKEFYTMARNLTVLGATVLLLCHTNKNLDSKGEPIFEGVGDVKNDTDELVYIYSNVDDESIIFTLQPNKVRSSIKSISFKYDKTSRDVIQLPQPVDIIGIKAIEGQLDKDSNIIECIKNILLDGPMSKGTLTDLVRSQTNVGKRKIRECINRWAQAGHRPTQPIWLLNRIELHNTLIVQLPNVSSVLGEK